jgi:hypothetical protein
MSEQPDKPKKPRKRKEVTVRVHRILPASRLATVGSIAQDLFCSVMALEDAEGQQMPHSLLNDAYEMAGMLVEASGGEPHERLLDAIVGEYLRIRQRYIISLTHEFYTKE